MLTEPEPEPEPERHATILGRRSRPSRAAPTERGANDPVDIIRFGPGVPTDAPGEAATAGALPAPGRRRGNRIAFVLSLLVTAVLVGALWWWLHRPAALHIESVHLAATRPVLGCDGTAGLRAVVDTDGGAGTIAYRWARGDGTDSGPLRQRIPADQRRTTLVLRWRVEGRGRFAGHATLVINAPSAHRASASFRYRCE